MSGPLPVERDDKNDKKAKKRKRIRQREHQIHILAEYRLEVGILVQKKHKMELSLKHKFNENNITL